MPVRPHSRDQAWLMPPHLEEMISPDHSVRYVAAFVDELDKAAWSGVGVTPEGDVLGAPAYHPRLLLSVWLYGFVTGVRSSRRLEAACREQLPYLWLTGLQTPDHNTLWRFYKEHRKGMRKLLRRTVRTAVASGFVDLALQAVDGTKIAGNASRRRTYDAAGLERLLERVEAAIADLEAQNRTAGEAPAARLPRQLSQATALRQKVKEALQSVVAEDERINLTDPDAALLKAPGGFLAGFNAQAVASPLAEGAPQSGFLITAVDVVQGMDRSELLPMLEAAEANLGQRAEISLADAGYHSAENVALCQEQGRDILMPEPTARSLSNPYHKDAFNYDAEADTYICPMGQILRYTGSKRDRKGQPVRRYRAPAKACRACPAFGLCTKDRRQGRALHIGINDAALRRHRALMSTEAAKWVYSRRKEIIEPVFGILKELQWARRFLLRGLDNVLSEWSLLATAFNLRTLAKAWAARI